MRAARSLLNHGVEDLIDFSEDRPGPPPRRVGLIFREDVAGAARGVVVEVTVRNVVLRDLHARRLRERVVRVVEVHRSEAVRGPVPVYLLQVVRSHVARAPTRACARTGARFRAAVRARPAIRACR